MQAEMKAQGLAPDTNAMLEHLQAWAEPVVETYADGLLAIRCIDPDGARPVRTRMFSLDDTGRNDAVEYATRQNISRRNVYIGLNPRKAGTDANSAASAEGVEAAFWATLDCDTKEASQELCRFIDDCEQPAPAFLVLTGTAPHPRFHAWWPLEEPIRNDATREAVMRGLAGRFGGDAISDAPRILRLAGSVSYPSERKIARGYVPEIVQLTIDPIGEAMPVSVEELRAAFPAPSTEPKPTKPAPANRNGGEIPALAKLSDEELFEMFANLPNDADRDDHSVGQWLEWRGTR